MPGSSAVSDQWSKIYQGALHEMRQKAQRYLTHLDGGDVETLSVVTEALTQLDFEQVQMAQWLGVSRTTVGRWAQRQNIPRSAAFRKWAISSLLEQLDLAIKAYRTGKRG
jgi:hypothetical protein